MNNKTPEEVEAEVMAIFDKIKFPESIKLQLPPPCAKSLEGMLLDYTKKSMTRKFPVLEKYTNPTGGLQGGFISAAFDDTFGPLSYLVCKAPTVTLNLNVDYIRSIFPGDSMTITAEVVSRGFSVLNMSARAFNEKGKLIATSTTNMVIFRVPKN